MYVSGIRDIQIGPEVRLVGASISGNSEGALQSGDLARSASDVSARYRGVIEEPASDRM